MVLDVIQAKNLSKSYKNKIVLFDVSFSLKKGEIHSLLGPNGAGKSTLIKLILGLEKPNNGQVFLFGETLLQKERIGVVPQQEFFFSEFTVKQNLELMGKMFNVFGEKLNQRIDFLINWLELKDFVDVKVMYLSGGYRRLLNIACSIVHDPEVIFLDEPTVALDPNIRKMLWKKILELKQSGKTICLTTHYLDEAEFLSDRVSILFNGKILETNSPETLIDKYGGKELIRLKLENVNEKIIEKLKDKFPKEDIKLSKNILSIAFSKKNALKSLGEINSFLEKNKTIVESSLIKEPDLEDVFINLTGEKPDE